MRWETHLVPIKHYPTINWNAKQIKTNEKYDQFQLNTIQRLTETWMTRFQLVFRLCVPIKHYPTINWNNMVSKMAWPYMVPIKHYPTINWNCSEYIPQSALVSSN